MFQLISFVIVLFYSGSLPIAQADPMGVPLCSPGWPQTQYSSLLSFPSTKISSMHPLLFQLLCSKITFFGYRMKKWFSCDTVLNIYHCILLLFTTPMAISQRNNILKISIYFLAYHFSEGEISVDNQFNMEKQFDLSSLPEPQINLLNLLLQNSIDWMA